MENSPFQKLSPELRNIIWDLAVTSERDTLFLAAKPPPITRACKQIRSESWLMFYSSNVFTVEIDAFRARRRDYNDSCNLKALNKWLRYLDHSIQASICGLMFTFNCTSGRNKSEPAKRGARGRVALLVDAYTTSKPCLQIEIPGISLEGTARLESLTMKRATTLQKELQDCGRNVDLVVTFP